MRRSRRFVHAGGLGLVIVALVVTSSAAASAQPAKLTPAQAEEAAFAALPTSADIGPGYAEQEVPPGTPTAAQIAADLPGCKKISKVFPGGSKRGVGSANRFFLSGFDDVFVDVAIFQKVPQAKAYMKIVRQKQAGTCANDTIAQGYQAGLQTISPGITIKIEPGAQLDVKAIDADDVAGAAGTVIPSSGDLPTQTLYVYSLRQGRAIATVTSGSNLSTEELDRIVNLVAANIQGL